MAPRGLSRDLLFAAAVLLLVGIGLLVVHLLDRRVSSDISSAISPSVPLAASGDSEDAAESVPVLADRSARETDRRIADDAQAREPNDEGVDEAVSPEPAIFPAGVATGGPPDPGYRIRGRVVSPEGPIQEEPGQWPRTLLARVDAPGYARQCQLDEEGRFECMGLDAGTYVVSVAGTSLNPRVHGGLLCEAVEVTLGPLSPLAELVLTLGREVPVTVVVLEKETFLPRAAETIIARSVSGVSEVSAGTDDQGCCVLGLIPGRYWIEARPWGSRGRESISRLVVVRSDVQDLSVQLFVPVREERMVRFVLVDFQGNPVKGYIDLDTVSPDPNRQPADTIAIPDPGHGSFGRLVGYAQDASGELARCFVCVEEAWGDGMKVVLEQRAGVVGRLLSADGLPAAGARLDLQQFVPDERWRAVDKSLYKRVVDGEGCFRFDGVPVGLDVRVCATAGRYQGDSGPIALKAGGTYDVGDLTMNVPESAPATGIVHGRVIDKNGQTFSDRTIWMSSGDRWLRGPMRKGRFVIGGVPIDRPVTIRVAVPGVGSGSAVAMAGDEDCLFRLDTVGEELLGVPASALVVDRWINHAPMTWEQLRSRVVLLAFCDLKQENPQDRTLPAILSLHRQYQSRGLIIIVVYGHVPADGPLDPERAVDHVLHLFRGSSIAGCLDADPNLVADLLPEDSPSGALAGATHYLYQVDLVPAVFLIDKRGKVRCCADLDQIRERIDLLLQE